MSKPPYAKGDPQARESGRKGGQAPKSLDARMRAWLQKDVVKTFLGSIEGQNALTKLGLKAGSNEDAIRFALLINALSGETAAAREILDRAFGKAPQSIKVIGDDDGGPVKFITNVVVNGEFEIVKK